MAVLVVETSASLFAAFCPSWFTVRSSFFHAQSAREGNISAIRQGEAAATIITLATGWAVSTISDSPLALGAAAIMCIVMIGGYEYSITHPAEKRR